MSISGSNSTFYDWQNDAIPFVHKWHYFLMGWGALYVPVVFLGQMYMRNRAALRFPHLLPLWNFALSIFSIIGTYKLFPIMIELFSTDSPFCSTHVWNWPNAWWSLVFILSKGPEFLDTLFLVFSKKPVIFLHWYHHIVTFLFCWYQALNVEYNAGGLLFSWMNFAVHSVMYAYFGVASLDRSYARAMAKMGINVVITTLQILQMVLGMTIVYNTGTCEKQDPIGYWSAMIMYGSYAILFSHLFVQKYLSSGKPRKELKKE